MQDFILRLKQERKELNERIDKLSTFIYSSKYDELQDNHRYLLRKQFKLMNQYLIVLDERLDLLGEENNEN